MKPLRVKTTAGLPVPGWKFGTFKAVHVGVYAGGKLQKPRKISGWQIVSPDGCARSVEGNYQQFIPFANLVLSNYGCAQTVS
jgi:hypothetical protein